MASEESRRILGRGFTSENELNAFLRNQFSFSENHAQIEASFLWKLAALKGRAISKGVGGEVIESVARCLIRLPHMMKESRCLGTTVIIGNPIELFAYLQIPHPVKIQNAMSLDSQAIRELSDLLDPASYAVIVDPREGKIRGVRALISREQATPSGFDLLADLTGALDCVALTVKRAERSVRMYVDGAVSADFVLSEHHGFWEVRDIEAFLSQFHTPRGVRSKVLARVFDIALELTYRGFGGLFVVGQVGSRLRTDPPRFPILTGQTIFGVDKETLVDLAKQDGATIISGDGQILKVTATVRPRATRIPEEYRGRTRHATAYLTSVQLPSCYVIVVSQNRSISLFSNGEKFPL